MKNIFNEDIIELIKNSENPINTADSIIFSIQSLIKNNNDNKNEILNNINQIKTLLNTLNNQEEILNNNKLLMENNQQLNIIDERLNILNKKLNQAYNEKNIMLNNPKTSSNRKDKKNKKKNPFLTLLKIIFFPIYFLYLLLKLVYIIIKNIVKLFIKIIKTLLIQLKKLFKFILRHKKGSIITAIVMIIAAIIGFQIKKYIDNYNKIFIIGKDFIHSSEYIYTLEKKIDKINIKINTLDSIKSSTVKINAGNLNLYEKQFKSRKKWKIDVDSLVMGANVIEITINYKNGKTSTKQLYIFNENEQNLGNLDINDDDDDRLINYEEAVVGTDPNKSDSDGDGLSDYDELYIIFTDPLKYDSDDDGINDAEDDNDVDKLTNLFELQNETNPNNSDSDSDGITDYDELYVYFIDPKTADSDGDGLDDGLEINEGLNPNEYNSEINYTKKSDDEILDVKLKNANGQQVSNFNIKSGSSSIITEKNPGYIAGPYDLSTVGEISQAEINFKFDESIIANGSQPTIYYVNKEDNIIEELETNVSGNIASATINHFSEYILMDKNYVEKTKSNAPRIDGSNVNTSSLVYDEYLIIGFPILNAFGFPVYIYKVDGNWQSESKESYQQYKTDDGFTLNLVFKRISKVAVKVIDKMFSWLESEIAASYSSSVGSMDNFDTFIQWVLYYKHVYNARDMEVSVFGEELNYIGDETVIDKDKDSNKDGISDYFTKLICNGQLATKAGENPFGDIKYSEIQKNKDYDKDGIANGEEIKIIEENGSYFVEMNSSPVLEDSDYDGVVDKHDASPLEKFSKEFIYIDSINRTTPTPLIDRLEAESNSVYNMPEAAILKFFPFSVGILNNPMQARIRAYAQAVAAGQTPAGKALLHFLDNTGTPFSFDDDRTIINVEGVQKNLNENITKMATVVESTVKINEKVCFASSEELTAIRREEYNLKDFFWEFAVSGTSAVMKAEAYNLDNENYKIILYYNIVDFYDWEINRIYVNGGAGGLVSDREMAILHRAGVAKEYRIDIPYKMEVTWNKKDHQYNIRYSGNHGGKF